MNTISPDSFYHTGRFKLTRDLQRHKSIHNNFKPHGCDICGLRFYQKSSIRGHFMRHHSSVLPYKCSFCDEQFHTKVLLTVNFCVNSFIYFVFFTPANSIDLSLTYKTFFEIFEIKCFLVI